MVTSEQIARRTSKEQKIFETHWNALKIERLKDFGQVIYDGYCISLKTSSFFNIEVG